MKLAFASLLTIALQLPAPQGTASAVAKPDFRVVPDKPAVYLTFEKRGAGIDRATSRIMETNEPREIAAGRDLWFRLHNNSHWTIYVRTASSYLDVKAFLDRGGSPGLWTALPDGVQVSLDYVVSDADRRERHLGGDAGAISPLPSGRSVLFSVNVSSLPKRWEMVYVYFSYDWERQQTVSGNLGPEHRVGYWSFRLAEDEKRRYRH